MPIRHCDVLERLGVRRAGSAELAAAGVDSRFSASRIEHSIWQTAACLTPDELRFVGRCQSSCSGGDIAGRARRLVESGNGHYRTQITNRPINPQVEKCR
jgi:hypothetical protein